MNKTSNIQLGKPLASEKYDISVHNINSDIIDTEIKKLMDKTVPASTTSPGIVMLEDSIISDSVNKAATPNSVRIVNDELALKAPVESPSFTGIPKAPTASAETNTAQIATTAFTQASVNNHNSSSASHSDIRDLISGLTTQLNDLANTVLTPDTYGKSTVHVCTAQPSLMGKDDIWIGA